MISKRKILVLLLFLLTLAGCTTVPIQTIDIIPHELTTWRHDPFTIKIAASGGKVTHAYGSAEISNEVFEMAVRESLQKLGLFKSIVNNNPDYLLNIKFKQPQVPNGFKMEATMIAYWQLVNPKSGNICWQSLVETSHSAGLGDALSGVKRLRIVKSKAAMKNIETALGRLETSDFVETEKELKEISDRWKRERKKEDFKYLYEHIIESAAQMNVRREQGPGISKVIITRRYFLSSISRQDVESLLGPLPENTQIEFEEEKEIYKFVFDNDGILNSVSFQG